MLSLVIGEWKGEALRSQDKSWLGRGGRVIVIIKAFNSWVGSHITCQSAVRKSKV